MQLSRPVAAVTAGAAGLALGMGAAWLWGVLTGDEAAAAPVPSVSASV